MRQSASSPVIPRTFDAGIPTRTPFLTVRARPRVKEGAEGIRSKREKVTEARALMEKAAVLLDEVGYDHEAEWVRDVANGLDVVVSNDPELEKTTGA